MNVRLANVDDLPELVALGAKFHQFSGELVPYCPASAEASARALLQMGFALIAEDADTPVGMIGVGIVPLFFNARVLVAQELMWWVDEGKRGSGVALSLLHEAEEQARGRGATRLQMVALAASPPQVAHVYQRQGYRLSETAFSKEI